jgi:hypothetical protein
MRRDLARFRPGTRESFPGRFKSKFLPPGENLPTPGEGGVGSCSAADRCRVTRLKGSKGVLPVPLTLAGYQALTQRLPDQGLMMIAALDRTGPLG